MTDHPQGPTTHSRFGELPACRHCREWDWTTVDHLDNGTERDVLDDHHKAVGVFRCVGCRAVGIATRPIDGGPLELTGAFDV
jgi:hypothetical protein